MVQFADVAIRYDRERIFRRLKIFEGTTVYDYALAAFPKLEQIVRDKLHMFHCYHVEPHTIPVGIPEVDRCAKLVTCLSTCTEDIMDEIGALLEGGEFLEGYILNDFVNEILFNASDQMNHQIASVMGEMDCRLTRRFSPGEDELDLEHQVQLMEAFQNEPSISFLSLTESYMLYPEKSMLYLYGADRENPEIPVAHDCKACPNVSCFFREEGHCTTSIC